MAKAARGLAAGGPWLTGLALAVLAACAPATMRDGYDWRELHEPVKHFYRLALLAGELPLWNPHTSLGRPFLADAETATLYPPNLLLLPLGPNLGAWLIVAGHAGWALAGAWRLGRRWGLSNGAAAMASVAFACSAPLLGRLQAGQFQVYCTLCWWPWLLFALETLRAEDAGGRAVLGCAAAWAMAWYAGSPPFFWVLTVGAAVWWLARWPARGGRRATIRLAGAALGTLGLTAAQLLPFLELVREGNRPLAAADYAGRAGMEAVSWLSLVAPWWHGKFYYWETNLYAGAALPLGALLAVWWWIRRRPPTASIVGALLLLASVGAALSLGSALPGFDWIAEHVPGMGAVRCPSRYALLTVFALAILAGLALTRGEEGLARRWGAARSRRLVWLIAAWWLVELSVVFWWRAPAYRADARPLAESATEQYLRHTGAFDAAGTPPRVSLPESVYRANAGLMHGTSSYQGFANPALARVWRHLHQLAAIPPSSYDFVHLPAQIQDSAALPFSSLNLIAGWDTRTNTMVRPTTPDPRAYPVFALQRVADDTAANARMRAGHDFHRVGLIEDRWCHSVLPPLAGLLPAAAGPGSVTPTRAAPTDASPPSSPSRVRIVRFTREHLTLAVEPALLRPALVVLAEAWYPGWRAWVDGTEAPVVPVNAWMRGIPAQAGTHTIEVCFRPQSVRLGVMLSAVSWLVWLAGLIWLGRPRRHPPAPACPPTVPPVPPETPPASPLRPAP